MRKTEKKPEIAVLSPCYNEELTIAKVVDDFTREVPGAKIYVYNNNSTDCTAEIAQAHGAIVVNEYRQGKGHVIRSMFRDIDADVYLMVDGDDTYPAEEAYYLINPVLEENADMVIGDRLSTTYYRENKKLFNGIGNTLVRAFVNGLFNEDINDVMTGYRAFSRRFVKAMPVMSNGFQIETEMTVYALRNNLRIINVPIQYRDRPEGSHSKLNTYVDGFKVLMTIAKLYTQERPLAVFVLLAVLTLICGALFGLSESMTLAFLFITAGALCQIIRSYRDHIVYTMINQTENSNSATHH